MSSRIRSGRAETFSRASHTPNSLYLSIRKSIFPLNSLHTLSKDIVSDTLQFMKDYDGIIYAVGELGITFEGYAKKDYVHKAGMIGVLQGGEELGIYMVEQDFEKMAGQIFRCLKQQNEGDSGWKASSYHMRGKPQF